MKQERLDLFVRRVMREKNLSIADVERRAGGEISDSYVHGIMSGKVKGSQTVTKLKALATGLGVSEDEIFAVARGLSPYQQPGFLEGELARLCARFQRLPDNDKGELRVLLDTLSNEIERRNRRAEVVLQAA
jgi:transcriptional regulator with XRE-family HTH domain